MLGLKDEYRDPNCPHRLPVETGTIMDTLEGAGHRRHFDVICGRPAPPAPLAGVWLEETPPPSRHPLLRESPTHGPG